MKLLAPLVFAAGTLAFSVDMRPRHLIARQATADLATDIEAITAATKDLGTAIQGFGSSTSALDVNGKASAVTDAINHGIIDAGDVQQIDQNDALSLANPVQELSKATEATIQTLISKKSAFVQAGLGDAVLQTLKQQQTASNKFSAALLSKLPPALQGPASNLAKPAADAINMGIVAYSSGTTPSSSSSAAAAPAPTTSTQAAAPVAQTTSTQVAAPPTTSTQAAPTTTMAAQTTTQAAPVAPQAPNTMPVVQISDGQIQAHPTTYGSFQGSFASQMPTTYGSYIPAASSAPYSYSYSKPGSTPSSVSPAAARYTGAAAPKAIVGYGAYAAVAMVAVAAL